MPVALSPDDADALLRERGHDPQGLAPLTGEGGFWSTTFTFRESGRDYVVRFHERRDDLEKDRFAERWRSPALRIPHMVEIGDTPAGPYGISERADGAPIDDLDEAGMRAQLPALLATLDAVREASIDGTRGYGLWHGDGNAPNATWRGTLIDEEAIARTRSRLIGTSVGTDGFDAGIARMRELIESCPEERHVVHNDLLYRNVLSGPRGIVMLDWGASIFGDFLYDAALLTFWWPYYAKRWGGIDIRGAVEHHYRAVGLDVPHFPERLRLCELDIGTRHILGQAERGHPAAPWTARRTADLAERDLASSD